MYHTSLESSGPHASRNVWFTCSTRQLLCQMCVFPLQMLPFWPDWPFSDSQRHCKITQYYNVLYSMYIGYRIYTEIQNSSGLSNYSFATKFDDAARSRGNCTLDQEPSTLCTCTIRHWKRLALTIPTRYGTGTERTGFLVRVGVSSGLSNYYVQTGTT